MRVIVTGGAGFIGSHLVQALLGQGHHVLTIDKLTYAGWQENLRDLPNPDHHRFLQADIADQPKISAAVDGFDPERIINLAAESHVDRSIEAPAAFAATNVMGTLAVLQASLAHWQGLSAARRQGYRYVQVSTDEVFGDILGDGRFSETSPFRPNSPYSASKAAADHFVRAFHRTYGHPGITTHCGNNYGPRQSPEKLIPLTILNAAAERPLSVYGRGLNVRDWIHVGDHVAALIEVLEQGVAGESYLIGAEAERTNLAIVRQICCILDQVRPRAQGRQHAALIEFVADRPGHDLRYAIDPANIRRCLNWRPAVDFENGLGQTVRWYLDHTGWCTAMRRRLEDRRLGLSFGGVP